MLHRLSTALSASCLLLAFIGSVQADRLVLIPSAYNLPPGSAKLEVCRSESKGGLTNYWVNIGLVGGLEIEGARIVTRNRQVDSLSLLYNLLPDLGFTPAVSIGIRDVADKTDQGSALYLAAAYRLPQIYPNLIIEELYVFGGVGTGGIKGFFFGGEARTPYRILLAVEYDSRVWNASLSWEPVPLFRLRIYSIGGETYYGASLAISF